MPSLALTPTLVILVLAGSLFVWSNLRMRRAPDPLRPRLLPHTLIMTLALVVVILMLAHLVSLVTGRPLTGRLGV